MDDGPFLLTFDDDGEVDAAFAVKAALEPLGEAGRLRVIGWAAGALDLFSAAASGSCAHDRLYRWQAPA